MKKTTRSQRLQPKAASPTDAASIAHQYARDVVTGKIPACQLTLKACQRHLSDIEKSKGKDFRYRFENSKAERACKFIENLPHTKDDWAGRARSRERIQLQPWQKFILCSLFGWIAKTDASKYRFEEAYIEVPRKNGKSILAAAIGLYKFAADGEFGAEVYSGATSEKQAWEVFRPARQIVERTPALAKAFGITVNAKSLTIEANGSRFEPVIGKPGDGSSPSCAIADEFHEQKTNDLVGTMRTGMGARKNPLLLEITTAGYDRSTPCYERHCDAQRLLNGQYEDDTFFTIIYGIDENDDWTSPDVLRKANPNYGVSIEPERLLKEQKNAVQSPRLQNDFRTKHENVWVNAAVGWMNMAAWEKCADESLSLDDFTREECMVGLDLANKVDIAAKVRLFRREIEGKYHYYAFGNYYLHEAAVETAANGHYRSWDNDEWLTVTPGNTTDFNWIADDLVKDAVRFNVRELPHDPANATPLIQFIQSRPEWVQSVIPVQIVQSKQNLSPPMKELEALVLEKRFHFDGDPVLTWMISNVIVRPDVNDLLFPRKERDENKIDGAVALLMALNRWMDAKATVAPSVFLI